MELKDSVAVITGASKGIGRAIALLLSQQEVTVVLAARSSDLLSMTQKEITEAGVSQYRFRLILPLKILFKILFLKR